MAPVPWARTGGRRWSPHFPLQAACANGTLYTLTVPGLQLLSRVSVFPNHPASLLCSPDCQWVFTLVQDSDLSPKVSGGLCSLSQGPGSVCTGSFLCPVLHMHLGGQLPAQGQVCSHSGPPAGQWWCRPLPRAAVLRPGWKGFMGLSRGQS